jgi:ABC-type polysaccharide/polyol phosphate transport system ATPase subunit
MTSTAIVLDSLAPALPEASEVEFAIDVAHVSKRFKRYHDAMLGPLKEYLLFWRRGSLYAEYQALHDVSFTIRRGEVVGIIGPNGAGKTTLLKMIAGLLPVTEGRITVRGKVTALLALGVGVHPEFSGRENIFFTGLLLGMSQEEIATKEQSIIEFSELGDFIEQPFRTYSSGMKARLLFAISMSVDPDILIVDEALATGDIVFVRKCERRIRELCASGATVLFVSHNLIQVNNLCDRSILLMKGRVAYSGPPVDVFHKYRELYVEHENVRLAEAQKTETFALVAGDGAVSLTAVVFRDAAGRPSNAFYTGAPMTIELNVKRHRPGNKYHIFIGFLMDSQYVGHIDTENLITSDETKTHAFDNEQRVVLRIEQLVMLNGVFSLWVLFQDVETRAPIAEYRNVGRFRVAKRHYPFDADAYFAQPVTAIEVDNKT